MRARREARGLERSEATAIPTTQRPGAQREPARSHGSTARTAALVLGLALTALGCGPRALRPRSAPLALTLPALDGGELELRDLRGQLVVLHVFTTWSVAAQLDVEQLVAADALPDVTVVGIALDGDGRPLVAPWRAAAEVRYLITLADDTVRAGRSVLGPLPEVPTTFVLDEEGRIVTRRDGQLQPDELRRLLASARR